MVDFQSKMAGVLLGCLQIVIHIHYITLQVKLTHLYIKLQLHTWLMKTKISQNGRLLQVSVVINDSQLLAHVIAAMSIKAWWKLVWSSRVSGGAAFSIPLRLRG